MNQPRFVPPRQVDSDPDAPEDLGVGPVNRKQRVGPVNRMATMCSSILCCSVRQYENMEAPMRTPGALSAEADDESDFSLARRPSSIEIVEKKRGLGNDSSTIEPNEHAESSFEGAERVEEGDDDDDEEEAESYRQGGGYSVCHCRVRRYMDILTT